MIFLEKLKKKRVVRDDEMFSKEVSRAVSIMDSFFESLTVVYCILLANLPVAKLPFAIGTGIFICVILHLGFHLSFCTVLTQSVSEDLSSFYNYDTTEKERTKLLKRLMGMPKVIGVEVFMNYVICSTAWIILLVNAVNIDIEAVILMAAMTYMGAFINASYVITNKVHNICSRHAANIVAAGVSKQEIDKIHVFGLKTSVIAVFHLFAPIIYTAFFIFLLAWRTYASYSPANIVFPRLGLILIVCLGSYVFFSTAVFKRMMRSINGMKDLMIGINRENLHNVQPEKTDLSNEFMYIVYLINSIVSILQKILKESQDISMAVVESSNELSVISRETAVTSLEQNSGVKELLSAMEETDALSRNIAEKIGEVSLVAKKTTDNIIDGFDILKQNMHKLDEIKNANNITVEGIKKLTEKITGISDIARIINGIADQTNIIAFNAEIEASSAGSVGENFALVANEIRRLTNNTIQSTNEIRKRIIEIQYSSEALLQSSRNGSNKIHDGTEIIKALNDRFEELQQSSETMDYAAEEIKKIIEQQTASFAQIVVTLRQITASSESFSTSTQKISDSAQNLCLISESLKELQPVEAINAESSADKARGEE